MTCGNISTEVHNLLFDTVNYLSCITLYQSTHLFLFAKATCHQSRSSLLSLLSQRTTACPGMEENDAVAEAFVCPITQEQMVDPVVALDGHSYSRAAIQDWFRQGRLSSPCTNERLASDQLVPNHSLRKAMEQRRAQQLQQQEQQRIAPDFSLKTVVLTVLVMLVGICLLLHCRHEDGDKSRCRDCYPQHLAWHCDANARSHTDKSRLRAQT